MSDYEDFSVEEGTDPGNQTFIGPAIQARPPAILMAKAKSGHAIQIPPKRTRRIPSEWGTPQLSITVEHADRRWTPDELGECMVCGQKIENHGFAIRRRPCPQK